MSGSAVATGSAASSHDIEAPGAATYDDLLDKRERYYKVARRMVQKKVPKHGKWAHVHACFHKKLILGMLLRNNTGEKEIDVLGELEDLVESLPRDIRQRLERTVYLYGSWCKAQNIPVLPIFAFPAALFVYDTTVSSSKSARHTFKWNLEDRQHLVSDVCWLADHANPHFAEINSGQQGSNFLASPRYTAAIQQMSETDEYGNPWASKQSFGE